MHQGPENTFVIGYSSSNGEESSMFRVVPGLDGRSGSVSIDNSGFNQAAASFVAMKGLKEYHPISFIANGFSRNSLMESIHSFRDEVYTSYLNIYP
ncbi:hypothetical protein K1719_036179 [Acacia pycnantha]|nr:hypothetical protein K1719_036179 [Acacia pycnantha]